VEGSVLVRYEDVVAARETIAGRVFRTPLIRNEKLDEAAGAEVWLKLENLQRTNAFKIRGGTNRLAALSPAERERGIVAASTGSHAKGMALAARELGIPATIVMPRAAPQVKVDAVRADGANVLIEGDHYDDACAYAKQLAESQGLPQISSFDDPLIIAGQGSLACEILEDQPEIDTFVAPIGGGGLASGLLVAGKHLKPGLRVFGVEAEGAPSMTESLAAGRPLELPQINTVADGIAVRRPGTLNFEIVQKLIDGTVLVSENEIAAAFRFCLEKVKILAEPAAAAAVAAVLTRKLPATCRRLAVIVTGGNVDREVMLRLLGV